MSTHNANAPDHRERPIGELVKDLAGQTSTLVRQEIQLAQAELTSKGKLAGRGAGMLAGPRGGGRLAAPGRGRGPPAAPQTPPPPWLGARSRPAPGGGRRAPAA